MEVEEVQHPEGEGGKKPTQVPFQLSHKLSSENGPALTGPGAPPEANESTAAAFVGYVTDLLHECSKRTGPTGEAEVSRLVYSI
jgi:hypothetical protein